MVTEPVRGRLPDAHLYALPGIDWLQSFARGLAIQPPAHHLTGAITTSIEPGSIVGFLPELGWLQFGDGTVDIRFACAISAWTVGKSMAPPAIEVRVVGLTVNDVRHCTLEGKALTMRSHLLQSGAGTHIAEVTVDDARGRTVGRASARVLFQPIVPAPVRVESSPHLEAPVYTTPDPYLRPVPARAVVSLAEIEEMGGWVEVFAALAAETIPPPPIGELLGIRFGRVTEGAATVHMAAGEWLVGFYPGDLFAGYLATLAHTALSGAAGTLLPSGHGLQVLSQSLSFLRPVAVDGREVTARSKVVHEGEFLVSTVEITDADGHQVAFGDQTSRAVPRSHREAAPPERVFATVLFTDIVGSTGMAERMGDSAWRDLLERHHRLVRDALQSFKGREVKTTGDGFLVTFDVPSRAVQCARAIRDGVRRLGLEIRAGLHSGECDLTGGDIVGLAVHVASRVQGMAGPGEILVTDTLRGLTSGSGIGFTERGAHQLKGIEGTWSLFAVDPDPSLSARPARS